MLDFFRLPENDIIFLSAATAAILAEPLSVDEQTTLGNFLMSVGQNIITGAAQKSLREQEKQEKQNKDEVKENAGS